MKTLGTTLQVYRGNIFKLERSVAYADGKPFMIASNLTNPYLLITVSSNTYTLKGKWTKNYWLDLSAYPKFDDMTPLFIESLEETPADDERLYYILNGTTREYYRYDRTANEYKPYEFVFTKIFLNSDTKQWIESEYQYQITFVAGNLTANYLVDTFEFVFPDEPIPPTKELMYKAIYKVRPDLVEDLDYNAVLFSYSENITLQKPSLIVVNANI